MHSSIDFTPQDEAPVIRSGRDGRQCFHPSHREALLDAFEGSGMSAMAFAAQHGVKSTPFHPSPIPSTAPPSAPPQKQIPSSKITKKPKFGRLITKKLPRVVYVPKPGFKGVVKFRYVVKEGKSKSKPATVTIKVRPR